MKFTFILGCGEGGLHDTHPASGYILHFIQVKIVSFVTMSVTFTLFRVKMYQT